MRRTRPAWALVIAVLLAAPSACGKEPSRRQRAQEKPIPADFKAGEIRSRDPADRPEAQQKATEEAAKVIALLNGLYSAGFVDSDKWSGGSHPGLAEFFSAEARPHIAPNLGALALGDLAPQIKAVRPTKQEARISFWIEGDLSTPVGVVTTVFEARATPAKGKTPVALSHNGSFWVVKEADAYKIYAYTTELKADSQVRSSAFGLPPGGPG